MKSTDQSQLDGDGTPLRPILLRGDGKPFRRPDHHLEFHRTGWRLRVTTDNGRFHVGQRIILPLGTINREEAEYARDIALAALHMAGSLAKPIIVSSDE